MTHTRLTTITSSSKNSLKGGYFWALLVSKHLCTCGQRPKTEIVWVFFFCIVNQQTCCCLFHARPCSKDMRWIQPSEENPHRAKIGITNEKSHKWERGEEAKGERLWRSVPRGEHGDDGWEGDLVKSQREGNCMKREQPAQGPKVEAACRVLAEQQCNALEEKFKTSSLLDYITTYGKLHNPWQCFVGIWECNSL